VSMADELIAKALASAKSEGWQGSPAFSAFAQWRKWCRQNDVKPLPVQPVDLTRCLLDLAAKGTLINTLHNLCSGACFAHHKAGLSRYMLIEELAWRSFTTAMNSAARGPSVVAPSISDIAAKAIERQERLDGSRRSNATG